MRDTEIMPFVFVLFFQSFYLVLLWINRKNLFKKMENFELKSVYQGDVCGNFIIE